MSLRVHSIMDLDDDDGDEDGDDVSLDAEGDAQAAGDEAPTAAAADGDHLATGGSGKESLQDADKADDAHEHIAGRHGKAGGRQGNGASGTSEDGLDDVMLSPDSSPAAAPGALLPRCLPRALGKLPSSPALCLQCLAGAVLIQSLGSGMPSRAAPCGCMRPHRCKVC